MQTIKEVLIVADHNNANVGFEKQIWNAACGLWGHIPAAEYRKVIVGLIFLRYISCAFEKRYQQLVDEGEGFEDDRDAYAENNVFFVPQEARWATIAAAAHTPEIGKVIDAAMKAIEAENPVLKMYCRRTTATQTLIRPYWDKSLTSSRMKYIWMIPMKARTCSVEPMSIA